MIHGTWDDNNVYTQAVVQAHTNLTEIDEALDFPWRNGIDSSNVVLGFYGRAFALKDSSCTTPGCLFSSEHHVKDVVRDSEQWVSYDDEDTFVMKMDYANRLCLGGPMVWALDLDKIGRDSSVDSFGLSGEKTTGTSIKRLTAVSKSSTMSLGMAWTVCLPKDKTSPCPTGFNAIAWGHGKAFDSEYDAGWNIDNGSEGYASNAGGLRGHSANEHGQQVFACADPGRWWKWK